MVASRLAKSVPVGGTGIAGAIESTSKITTNPNVRALFKNVPLRNFSFTFQLVPTSQQEARMVEDIIKIFREEAKKKRELKKQKQKEWAKRQESENNNSKIENHTNSQKDKKKSIYSNKNNYQKVKKLEINQDNLGNIKFTNSKKPKLGIKV